MTRRDIRAARRSSERRKDMPAELGVRPVMEIAAEMSARGDRIEQLLAEGMPAPSATFSNSAGSRP